MRTQVGARAALFVAVLALALADGTVCALATSLTTDGTPDYAAGTVPLVVEADEGVTRVVFEFKRSGDSTHTVEGDEGPTGVFRYDLRLTGPTIVVARAFTGTAEVWSASSSLVATGLEPGRPALSLKSRQLVRSNTQLSGVGAARAATMTIQTHKTGAWVDEWTGPAPIDPSGAFELPNAGLPLGTFTVRVVAANGFGLRRSAAVRVYNLGAVPSYKRLVLVDKSSRRLYVIVNGRVTNTCRCAIGMPWTPTPTGTFRLGVRHKTPNAFWGPWRLQLSRRVTSSGKTRYVRTKYYIHGTSVPSSIGHMRSHGCIRLLNKNIRKLSTRIDGYMAVIRE